MKTEVLHESWDKRLNILVHGIKEKFIQLTAWKSILITWIYRLPQISKKGLHNHQPNLSTTSVIKTQHKSSELPLRLLSILTR